VHSFGQRIVGERLLHLDGFVGVDESVDVRWHGSTEITADVSDTVMSCWCVP